MERIREMCSKLRIGVGLLVTMVPDNTQWKCATT